MGMHKTSIEWTHGAGRTGHTWQVTRGCSRHSPGCGGAAHVGGCYAEGIAARFSGEGQPFEGYAKMTEHGPRWTGVVRPLPENLDAPLRTRAPGMVFVNSMSDLFHEDVPFEYIAAVFGVMAASPQHIYQVLTKRADRMVKFFIWLGTGIDAQITMHECVKAQLGYHNPIRPAVNVTVPLPNVWLGVSVENQKYADERIPHLLRCPAAVRFVSYEPALGPVDFGGMLAGLDQVIIGAESGRGARPFDEAWAPFVISAPPQG